MARMVRRCINLVWLSLSGVKLSSFYWGFAYLKNSELMPHFQIFEFLSCVVVQLEYVECRLFLFASWGEKICCKVKRTSFVAIDSAKEVTKSQP